MYIYIYIIYIYVYINIYIFICMYIYKYIWRRAWRCPREGKLWGQGFVLSRLPLGSGAFSLVKRFPEANLDALNRL